MVYSWGMVTGPYEITINFQDAAQGASDAFERFGAAMVALGEVTLTLGGVDFPVITHEAMPPDTVALVSDEQFRRFTWGADWATMGSTDIAIEPPAKPDCAPALGGKRKPGALTGDEPGLPILHRYSKMTLAELVWEMELQAGGAEMIGDFVRDCFQRDGPRWHVTCGIDYRVFIDEDSIRPARRLWVVALEEIHTTARLISQDSNDRTGGIDTFNAEQAWQRARAIEYLRGLA